MRTKALLRLAVVAGSIGLPMAAVAGGHNLSDFPLRVHVYQANARTHYSNRMVDFIDGEGRANLFEQSEPRGFDFNYRCDDRVLYSSGYETYPARWKKPGLVLEMLLPVMGKTNAYSACELKVALKPDLVYHSHNGMVSEEPAARYKEWMQKVQYDPENGKNQPIAEPKPVETK